MKKADWQEVRTPPIMRGTDKALFYNAFLRVNGAQDKLTYVNELYQFYQQMQTERRKVCILDGALPIPSPEEIQKIRRRNALRMVQNRGVFGISAVYRQSYLCRYGLQNGEYGRRAGQLLDSK